MSGPGYHGRTHSFILSSGRVVGSGTDPIPFPDISGGTGTPFDELVPDADLTGWWRLGDTFTFASTVADAALDSAVFGGVHRDLDYEEATSGHRPTLQVANPSIGVSDDGAVQFAAANNTDFTDGGAYGSIANFGTTADLARSVSVWFKTGAALTGTAGVQWGYPIVGRWTMDPGGSYNVGWVIDIDFDDGSIRFRVVSTGGTVGADINGPILETSTWYHAAATYDGTTYTLYLNGFVVATSTSAVLPASTATFFRIGVGSYDSGVTSVDIYFNGTVDEVATYKKTLSADEVEQLAFGIGAPIAVRTVTAAYTILTTDDYVLANGTFTVTLPSATGLSGHSVVVKNTGVGTITVGRTGGQNIDGAAANHSMTVSKSARVFLSDGAGWQIVGAYL